MKRILDALLAAMRTSEFWAVLAQAVIEAVNAPVPEEVKAAGWAYIVLRIVSKVVKSFPAPK